MRQFTALQLKTASAIWRRAVKSTVRLTGLLARATPLIVGSSSLSWVKASFHFARFVTDTIKTQGSRGLAIYLKACSVLTMQSVSGHVLQDPRKLGVAVARTGGGLPRVIPMGYRLRIKQGDVGAIRLWLGFFSLYRVLDFRGKLKVATIIKPGKVLTSEFLDEWDGFCKEFVRSLEGFGVKPFRLDLVPERQPGFLSDLIDTKRHPSPLEVKGFVSQRSYRAEVWGYVVRFIPLLKSGPNSGDGRLNVACVIDDWLAWVSRPKFFRLFVSYVALVRGWNLLPEEIFRQVDQLLDRIPAWRENYGDLGALAAIEEPGKVRVVAMVDSLTQWLLYPLHRYFYDKVLRLIPQDGLWDQLKPIEELIERRRNLRDHRLFSYDLSAATDRIPVVISESVLRHFSSGELASLWRRLLVERDYRLPPLYLKTYGVKAGTHVRYAVGQPMGALSSWAMLAITHHAMVQFSARKAGLEGWFGDYAVLGDDLVIGDYRVAHEYTCLCEILGVEIGLHKSIIGKNLCAEFAKAFFYRGTRLSPVPLVGIAVGWLGVRALPELARLVFDWTDSRLSWFHIGKFMGVGFKGASALGNTKIRSLSKRASSIVLLLTRVGAVFGTETLVDWFSQIRANESTGPDRWDVSRVLESFATRASTFKSLNLRKRLFKALRGFDLSQLWSKETLFGVHDWWEANVVDPIRSPILERLTEVEERIESILSASPDGIDLQLLEEVLREMEDLEAQVAMIPTEMVVMKSTKETLHLRSDRFPRRVRLWRKVSKAFTSRVRKNSGVPITNSGSL